MEYLIYRDHSFADEVIGSPSKYQDVRSVEEVGLRKTRLLYDPRNSNLSQWAPCHFYTLPFLRALSLCCSICL